MELVRKAAAVLRLISQKLKRRFRNPISGNRIGISTHKIYLTLSFLQFRTFVYAKNRNL